MTHPRTLEALARARAASTDRARVTLAACERSLGRAQVWADQASAALQRAERDVRQALERAADGPVRTPSAFQQAERHLRGLRLDVRRLRAQRDAAERQRDDARRAVDRARTELIGHEAQRRSVHKALEARREASVRARERDLEDEADEVFGAR